MKHPLEVDQQQIVHFLNYLANERNVASSTQNQALCALVFLYREVLKQQIGVLENFKTAKRYHPVPVVLSEKEGKRILADLPGEKGLMFHCLNDQGFRIQNCVGLR